jgi:hypothetical protein
MSPRESTIEKYLCKRVRERGGKTRKINGMGERFWPDRLVVDPELGMFLVELKRPVGGRLSAGQVERITEIRAAGGRVELLWTKEMIYELLG